MIVSSNHTNRVSSAVSYRNTWHKIPDEGTVHDQLPYKDTSDQRLAMTSHVKRREGASTQLMWSYGSPRTDEGQNASTIEAERRDGYRQADEARTSQNDLSHNKSSYHVRKIPQKEKKEESVESVQYGCVSEQEIGCDGKKEHKLAGVEKTNDPRKRRNARMMNDDSGGEKGRETGIRKARSLRRRMRKL
ncbi:hypothetical protein R1sor_023938 [Riccia sorocarpa]|uniref:Uncharacterized protein n=1 Tax=Riccia sorocarpa TaxID=122646 RepID=A0ABD3GR89_9MARC